MLTKRGLISGFSRVKWANYGLFFTFIATCVTHSIVSSHFLTIDNIAKGIDK